MVALPPCPVCGGKLYIEERPAPSNVLSFSIAGTQLRIPVRLPRWWIFCEGCRIEREQS